MIIKTCTCSRCGSEDIVKNGKNKSGTQTYKCKSCGACRVLSYKQKTKHIDKEAVLRTYAERNSYRSTARIFGISHVTVLNWLKKSQDIACVQK